jgi:hypothetical protein
MALFGEIPRDQESFVTIVQNPYKSMVLKEFF